ncbi:metallophosphoesterase family protein [Bacillus sp. 1NLA3E]|uniref:metallophosphoesterase family protein n=1 Tax=Bacillus sp. 1NLA3E TaxID=666686 RepID=UPI000247E752|nr:DNA repair exonuclease [Bacillus sp. 1NLA3E]AGK52542.1 metallophosphoesterase [Bacillus sp. 1NLA3E]
MKKVTFIHAADLHLDSPMVGLKHLPQSIFTRLQESTFTAFSKIIDAAILHQVDFVILGGDLFDGEDRSIRAQTRFRKQIERLYAQQIPVFIVHGNHDHLEGKWANIQMPQNAYIFPADVAIKTFMTKDKTTVSLYGFSYPRRHVLERRIDDYIKEEGADFHIGILHGHFEGNSDHGRYAPFTLSDLLEKQFDYWALGHIHKRTHLSEDPPVIYPGNIQGRHSKETGEKGCYLVTLTEANTSLEFISSSDVLWEDIEGDATSANSVDDLYRLSRNIISEMRKEGQGILVTIRLKNVSLMETQQELLSSEELLETLQDDEKDEESMFVWPVDLFIEEANQWNREQMIGEADFYSELFQSTDHYENSKNCLSPLYQHSSARKYVTLLSDHEQEQLIKDAESILVQLLKKG